MKKALALVLVFAMMVLGFAMAEESKTVADLVVTDSALIVVNDMDVNGILADITAASSLSEYFGADVEGLELTELFGITVSEKAEGAVTAVFQLPVAPTASTVAMIGVANGAEIVWTAADSAVVDGNLAVDFDADTIAACQTASAAVVAILQ